MNHMLYFAPEECALGTGLRCLYDPYFYGDDTPRPVTHTREQVNEITATLARHAAHILASNARCVADWLRRGMLAEAQEAGR